MTEPVTTPCIGFWMRCRFMGCTKRTVVHVTRSSGDDARETSMLSPQAGWIMMFRHRDEFTVLTAALCPDHAGNWEDDEP